MHDWSDENVDWKGINDAAYYIAHWLCKWPHLYEEIVSMADYGELFEGHIPGYKHTDYWITSK